ncbi:hypothetical protein ABPG72_020461 [Tetrahymena utriculariae]
MNEISSSVVIYEDRLDKTEKQFHQNLNTISEASKLLSLTDLLQLSLKYHPAKVQTLSYKLFEDICTKTSQYADPAYWYFLSDVQNRLESEKSSNGLSQTAADGYEILRISPLFTPLNTFRDQMKEGFEKALTEISTLYSQKVNYFD